MPRPKTTKTGAPHYANLYKDLQEEWVKQNERIYNLECDSDQSEYIIKGLRKYINKLESAERKSVEVQEDALDQCESATKQANTIAFFAVLLAAACMTISIIKGVS